MSKTPEGFLLCLNVPIARTGEMIYGDGESPIKPGPDGRAIVVREANEVFRPETIASFEGKPFTIKHPDDFVDPSNWRVLAKGLLQNVRRGNGANENDLMADILVTDADAIRMVEVDGIREVSCGYECEYIELGVGRGMQTNIVGNHLALVEQGRAGTSYAINDQKGAKMKKLGESIKSIFAKAGDEAAKVVDDASKGDDKGTPVKTDDEAPAWATKLQKTIDNLMAANPSGGNPSVMDEEAKKKAADEEEKKKAADAEEAKKKEAADAEEKKAAFDSDFSAMKDAVKSLCDAAGIEYGAKDESEEEEESEDADVEEEDDDFEESPAAQDMAKDEKSRIEILAPGFKAKGKDARRDALTEAYKSTDTKAIIDRLNGGKPVDFKKINAKTVDHLFIGASEVVGLYRTKNFTKWKQVRDSGGADDGARSGGMTPEEINKINEKHYAQEKGVH